MSTITAFVMRHPLVVFFILSYVLTWPLIPLVSVSPLWGFPALFGPALAAVIVAAVTDGRPGLRDLLGRLVRWRVGARWYAVVLGLPAVLALTAAGLHLLLGAQTSINFGGLSVLSFVVYVLIVGEELGWRGYAFPRLLAERSTLAASLILGALWGVWHLPTFFVPGAPQYGLPFSAFVLMTIAYSVLIGWCTSTLKEACSSPACCTAPSTSPRASSSVGWNPRGRTGCWPASTVRRRSPWRSFSGRTSRVSITWERIVPG